MDGCQMAGVGDFKFIELTMPRVQTLSVVRTSFAELDKSAFESAGRTLSSVDLSFDGIAAVHPAAFCPIAANLVNLNLSSNNFVDLADVGVGGGSRRSCESFAKLRSLVLTGNAIERLTDDAPIAAPNLEVLHLDRNRLNYIADRALVGFRHLRVLNLAHNSLNAVPSTLFDSANGGYLQELYLQNNSLSILPPGLFDGLSNLLVLNLSRNALIASSVIFPKSLSKLVALDLSNNQLAAIEPDTFGHLVSLQVLNLAHNLIHSVSEKSFASLSSLHALVLSHNHIDGLPRGAFNGLKALSSLSIDHNKLHSLLR